MLILVMYKGIILLTLSKVYVREKGMHVRFSKMMLYGVFRDVIG